MYNHELTLISYTTTKDEIGNPIKTPIREMVLCKVRSIGSSEYYNAQVSNLKPEIKFIIHDFEYSDQKEVEFEGNKYQVMRTYRAPEPQRDTRRGFGLDTDEIELTCERVLGNG